MTRVVLVSGASGGVGQGIAVACGRAGWTVWIAARRADEGEAVAAEVDAAGGVGRFVPCDVADEASVASAVEAAVATRRAARRRRPQRHQRRVRRSPARCPIYHWPTCGDHVAVSLRGTFLLARASAPHLERSGGSLVVLTSEAGFEGKARLPAYASVKAAQRGLVRSLAREWGPRGMRVERGRRPRDVTGDDRGLRARSGHVRTGARSEPAAPPRGPRRGHRRCRPLPAR